MGKNGLNGCFYACTPWRRRPAHCIPARPLPLEFAMLRRQLLLSPLAAPALAQGWVADRTIRIIAPFAPGGASDVISRILAEEISPLLGQQVVVENRTGAGGSLGGYEVARAAAARTEPSSPRICHHRLRRRVPQLPLHSQAPQAGEPAVRVGGLHELHLQPAHDAGS